MKISAPLETLLARTDAICVLTGAGISAESGIATFRGVDGIWSKFRPEELANFDAFMKNPQLVWEWYQYRRTIVKEAQPNHGHEALATLEPMIRDFTLVTQNVDNLHRRAGSVHVLELHGNIERSYCLSCGTFDADVAVTAEVKVPRCRRCAGVMRPDVVWFGEMLPQDVLEEAEAAARRCELFLTVGTSGIVFPAAGLPLTAKAHGAYVVEINPDETDISRHMDEVLRGASGVILPELLNRMQCLRGIAP